ncbi:unnamed protein product [Arctogadus glacialis]
MLSIQAPSCFYPPSCIRQFSDLLIKMVELAFYPAVALMYFFAVMRASKENLVELDDRASLNVFCLFVLCQPLCLVVGSYTGMLMYLITALVSYYFLPWSATAAAEDKDAKDGKPSKKKKREKMN